MKIRITLRTVAFLITGLFMLSACNKDQQLIADIEGEYKIESVINYRNGEGTPVIFTSGRIFFQDCKMKDGVGGNCEGWFEFEGKPKVTFQYHTKRWDGEKAVFIYNLNSLEEPIIMGDFEFTRDGDSMILNGIEQSGGSNGVTNTWYSNIRLSKM
jgi:hypothetical protein